MTNTAHSTSYSAPKQSIPQRPKTTTAAAAWPNEWMTAVAHNLHEYGLSSATMQARALMVVPVDLFMVRSRVEGTDAQGRGKGERAS